MNYLRSLVSGKKKRYREDGFNLDLSYITERLIAMAIPGEGLTKIYRNPLESVSKFLNDYHKDNYMILNLSGIRYDYSKFDHNVKEFPWSDHYPPPIELLFKACQEIHSWLTESVDHIVAINCRAGKGRTGTLICCYLIYSGRITDPEQALTYYRRKRFNKGGGVQQPSQVRYVQYFAEIFHGRVKCPIITKLTKIRFRTAPHSSGISCKPVIEISRGEEILYTNKAAHREDQNSILDSWEDVRYHEIFKDELALQGDILCRISHWGAIKLKTVCRFSFNTGFIEPNCILRLSKAEIDPFKLARSKKISDYFTIELTFKEVCSCTPDMALHDRCQQCISKLDPQEIAKWRNIKKILFERINENSSRLLFGSSRLDDIDEVLNQAENCDKSYDEE
ncbi:unnamed protein product [Blepharisma stoltei]|uniref:Phosphatidylinositol-3,4,5-trisphosphate 3-phosphatase n=1 Tax=Blepharisma stoltei TaxID=1481888 RepID=A0AAU9ID24_9CILI|nr:unnamed protein product [Blepharisma stoltei]